MLRKKTIGRYEKQKNRKCFRKEKHDLWKKKTKWKDCMEKKTSYATGSMQLTLERERMGQVSLKDTIAEDFLELAVNTIAQILYVQFSEQHKWI